MRVLTRIAGGCLGALTLFAAGVSAQSSAPGHGAAAYRQVAELVYAVVDGRELKLDLYLPENVVRPPLIVWVHGGAWRNGSKESPSGLPLVAEGFALASVDFRNSVDAIFPAQVHDIKAAIRYLRATAGEHGYDAARLGIAGSSSGGHLAALVATTNGHAALEGTVGEYLDQSSAVSVAVVYYGASNLNSILAQSTVYGVGMREPALALLLGGPIGEREELARLASPVTHVDASDPPLLLLHGDQDPQMPINQSHELHGVYKQFGLPAKLEVVHGAKHGGEMFYDRQRTALVAEFLREQLR